MNKIEKKLRDAFAAVFIFTAIAVLWVYEKVRGKPLNFK